MAHTTIAIVADCDETLAPDTTGQLLTACGLDPRTFFAERAAALVKAEWDPALAYLYEIIKAVQTGEIELTEDKLIEIGRGLSFYEGAPDCFARLKDEIENDPEYRPYGIRVEFYVISGGVEQLIRSSSLGTIASEIWGCNFAYDTDGKPFFLKNVLSFTDKTRFLFLIQKGKVAKTFRSQPYVVNSSMSPLERPIPFENMIYLGDGPSDIPCMSLLQREGGYVIGLLDDANPYKTWALGYGRRANVTVPQDYRPEGHAYKQLKQALVSRANFIRNSLSFGGPVPGF
jgi:hypothetical protein